MVFFFKRGGGERTKEGRTNGIIQSSADLNMVGSLNYINLEDLLLKSYIRMSHKGVYQNKTLGLPSKKIENIYIPFNYLIASLL